MPTQFEVDGAKRMAKSMSVSDLRFQLANEKKLRVGKVLTAIFKKELDEREALEKKKK